MIQSRKCVVYWDGANFSTPSRSLSLSFSLPLEQWGMFSIVIYGRDFETWWKSSTKILCKISITYWGVRLQGRRDAWNEMNWDTYVHRRYRHLHFLGPCNQRRVRQLRRRSISHLKVKREISFRLVAGTFCARHLWDSPKAFKLCSNSARSIVPFSCLSYNLRHSMKSS